MAAAAQPLPGIEHVVVLMFENRSFDNMLGGLYPQKTSLGEYDGLRGTEWNRRQCTVSTSERVSVFQGATAMSTMVMPYPDPGELFSDMNEQIFCPNSPSSGKPTMDGFVSNYAGLSEQPPPVPRDIMQYYAPGPSGNIPITSALAQAYAVCDQWFAAGPVQTLVNRTFVQCASPTTIQKNGTTYAKLNNGDFLHGDPVGSLHAPTIYEMLDERFGDGQLNWKIYYHDLPNSILSKYVWDHWHLVPFEQSNVWQFNLHFEKQVREEGLPRYTFIEPRYTNDELGIPPNSNHPGPSHVNILDPNGPGSGPPISVCFGEELLRDVYRILSDNGLLSSTLLVITYDEHGGLYDHIPPPPAPSPFAPGEVQGFDYSRYGVRVPALLINDHIRPETIWPAKVPNPRRIDHTSIIGTLVDQWSLRHDGKAYLTPRDENARRLEGFLDPLYRNPFKPARLPTLDCKIPRDTDVGKGEFERPAYVEDPDTLHTAMDRMLANPEVQERIRGQRENG